MRVHLNHFAGRISWNFRAITAMLMAVSLAGCRPEGPRHARDGQPPVAPQETATTASETRLVSPQLELLPRPTATVAPVVLEESRHLEAVAQDAREMDEDVDPVGSQESDAGGADDEERQVGRDETAELGRQLYQRHCAACHGDQGDGVGLAARFLFPKPRDLRAGRYRLISTANNVPSDDDLRDMLIRGMPGSSMPPWGHLNDDELDALIGEIRRLRREGLKENYVRLLIEEEGFTEDEIAEDDIQIEIEEYADEYIQPGSETEVPEFGPADELALARGREVYVEFGCLPCHGNEGKGDGVQEMFDLEGYPSHARDFTVGIFKGRHDPASLYRRIAYGMPGSPMPGSQQMTPDQMVDLVHYLRSLSTEEQRQAAILNRARVVARRVESMPESAAAGVWNESLEVSVRLTPLWWRDDADPDLRVQAVHDGESLMFRLSWQDSTPDWHSLTTESFRDAVAIQLHRGNEPFLGMGDSNARIEAWFWDADRQQGGDVDQHYPRMVVDIYPFSEQQVDTAEFARAGTRFENQPEVSLPAVAVGNQMTPRHPGIGGSQLDGAGPGSTSFRLPQSQHVQAEGQWADGRWVVVMTRPLHLPAEDDGLRIDVDEPLSVAFAVWDGSAGDRDGRKLISIWQELVLDQ